MRSTTTIRIVVMISSLKTGKSALNPNPPVWQNSVVTAAHSFVGIVVPWIIRRIVGAVAGRGGARITGVVAAGIVVAIALGWILRVPDAPA
jgi:hypothetical protein